MHRYQDSCFRVHWHQSIWNYRCLHTPFGQKHPRFLEGKPFKWMWIIHHSGIFQRQHQFLLASCYFGHIFASNHILKLTAGLLVNIILLYVYFPSSRLAAVVAVCTTSTAVVLICIGSLLDYGTCSPHHAMPDFHPANYFLAMGTLLFAYGGHPAFPTVQHNMRRPQDFNKSSLTAFASNLCIQKKIPIWLSSLLNVHARLHSWLLNLWEFPQRISH